MRILLAEDIGVTRRLLAEVLTDMGHDVTAVGDGAEAWEAWELAPFPMVVLDWMMPALDGLELCARIRAHPAGHDTFLLLQTGRGTSEDLDVALAAGVDDYIAKPVSPEHLRARIAIALARIELQKARRITEAELARARWLAGVGETALALQHEMSSPLSALLGEIALGLDAGGEEALRGALTAAQAQARRIADVLRRLSALKSPQSVEALPGVRMIDLAEGRGPNG